MGQTIHSEDYRALLTLLRSLREEAGLTQVELAERLGRPQSFVSKIEVGERRLDVAELRMLTEALGQDVVDIVQRWVSSLGSASHLGA